MATRIQSLYLLLAALLAFGSMALPFWSFTAGQAILIGDFSTLEGAGMLFSTGSVTSGILSPVTGIASLAAIFLFRNRKLQRQLILLCMLFFAGDLLSALGAAHVLNQHLQGTGAVVMHQPATGLFLLLPEPLLFWLALRGVQKDEKIATAYKRL
jgi:hypothetical protein